MDGDDYSVDASLEGYARLTIKRRRGAVELKMRTVNSMDELMSFGTQRLIVSVDRSEIAGEHGGYATAETRDGEVVLKVNSQQMLVNALLTDRPAGDGSLSVFETSAPPSSRPQAFVLAR